MPSVSQYKNAGVLYLGSAEDVRTVLASAGDTADMLQPMASEDMQTGPHRQ